MTRDAPRIIQGLPEHLRRDAARIYLEAFGRKLSPVLGRDARAEAFLARVLRPEQAIVALDAQGGLLGLAGFHDERTGLIGGDFGDLAAVYGVIGAAWRMLALSLFERAPEPDEILLDGIAVRPDARSKGVGSTLLTAVMEMARENGVSQVRLDVVDANPRARALYERTGFVAVREQSYGFWMRPFGFSASTTMVRAVSAATYQGTPS